MKANELSEKELRIGNKILGIYIDDCDNHIDERCTVVALDSTGRSKHRIWVESENPVYEDFDYFEPIPLTEDWLKRLGLTQYSRETYNIGLIWVEYYNSTEWEVSLTTDCYPSDIQYVHQLQNLYFALTGEELKIINK